MMETRSPVASGLRIPDRKTCHSMLKKYMPPEFKKKLLWEGISDSIQQFVHALAMLRSLSLDFSTFE